MPFIQTIGFLPDVAPTTPGVITECNGFLPSKFGMKSAYSAATLGLDALAAACKGFVAAQKTDGTTRVIAGSAVRLYELSGTSWTNRTRAVGGDYSSGTTRWRFAQFGDITIAVNQFDTPQTSSSGAFANLAAMPKARVIDVANQFVMIAATNEGTFGDSTDRWWCCGIGDSTDWTPSVATQCVTGRLVDAPGPITALRTLGDYVVIYKQKAMYLGVYQGPPLVWGWRLVSSDIGTWSQESVVKVGFAHYFIGYDNIYRFDGSQPVPIGDGMQEWFFNDLAKASAGLIAGFYDRLNALIYWFYPSQAGGGAVDKWIAYQPASGRWGAGTLTIEAAGEYITPAATYDTFGVGLTFDTLPDVMYDSDYWSTSNPVPAVFNGSHQLCTLTGASGTNSLVFGWVGDDQQKSTVTRVTPRWLLSPTSAELTHTYAESLGGTQTVHADSPVTMRNDRFDFRQTARWHQDEIEAVGNCEIGGLNITAASSGTE